jgi:hypothetical protein
MRCPYLVAQMRSADRVERCPRSEATENISRDDISNRSTTGLILILLCQPKSVQTSVIRS